MAIVWRLVKLNEDMKAKSSYDEDKLHIKLHKLNESLKNVLIKVDRKVFWLDMEEEPNMIPINFEQTWIMVRM